MEDTVNTELDDVKAELEKLKAECRVKTQHIESLRNDHGVQFQEITKLAEKRAFELDLKSEEIYELKRINDDLKSSLNEKEKHIVHLSLENNKIQARFAEKVSKLEGSNSELVLALDEITARNDYLERNVSASSEEISRLKSLLLVTEKKCIEAEERARQAEMLRLKEDVIMQLEEENTTVHDKIKWRNEQFKHLEEAYQQLKVQFRSSKEEWETERSSLVSEISSLQTSLDSQTRTLEGLQSRFEMCNHALACEEGKRKLLEAEMSEYKTSFEDVYGQCEEKKSEIQRLTVLRNEEIAELRNSLGEKETLVKELERKIVYLEQDNQELGDSLKEFREAQIRDAGGNSMTSKIRNKLRKLEEVHKNCSAILKSKESQWGDQIAEMEADIIGFKSALTNKEQEIRELQMELENCSCAIVENQIELLIFKSVVAEAYCKSFGTETVKEVCVKDNEDMILNFTEQLRAKDKSLKTLAQQQFLLEEELEQQKKLLEESSAGQLILKEQLLKMENTLKHERNVAFEALEMLKNEMTSKNDELSRLDCEMQKWKSTAETLKVSCEEIQVTCKEMETSLLSRIENEQALTQENKNLLCIVKDQERETEDLQLQVALLESCNAEKTKAAERFKQEKDELVEAVMEKDCCIKGLQKDMTVANLKQESMKKELEDAVLSQLDAQKALEQVEDLLWKIKGEKDQTTKHFQELAKASEQDLLDALCFSFAKQVEKLVEVSMLTEALKNAEYLSKLEIEEKNTRMMKLELEINCLLENLAHTEESCSHLKRETKQFQTSLGAMELETKKLTNEKQKMAQIIAEIEFEKGNLVQDLMKLSTEREEMLAHIEFLYDKLGDLSEDVELVERLGNILDTSIDDENETAMDSLVCDKLHGSAQDSANDLLFPPTTKKIEENFDERLPLREVNSLHL
jgi:chromosome segregation ATPase